MEQSFKMKEHNNVEKVFEITSPEIWRQRDEWIDKIMQELEVGSYLVSEHSTALFLD